jgi:hypothetical protein
MRVHFTPEQEALIARVAASTATDPEALVRDATLCVLEDALFRAAVKEGKAYAERGEFIEEEDRDARFERNASILDAHPLDPPQQRICKHHRLIGTLESTSVEA